MIGFPQTGGAWVVVKGYVGPHEGRHLYIYTSIQDGYSGGPIIHDGQVVGLVVARGTALGLGVTAKTLQDFLEGFKIVPQPAIPSEESSGEKRFTGKDGAPMVLVPAGEFMMGSHRADKKAELDERPVNPVYLDAFYIDQYEVTTARYAKFFQETKRSEPKYWSEQVLKRRGRKPVVGMDWNDAAAYCSWAGKRLPTEAEWEKAARGPDQRLYPWGNAEPSRQRANFNHCCDFDDYGILTDVGSIEGGKSPYGAYDMAGNVSEWVADWYGQNYYSEKPERNPTGPLDSEWRVLRGGAWHMDSAHIRSADRERLFPTTRDATFGFRCAQDAPK